MSNDLNPARNFRYDIPSSIVVFLVALPLCLGIALASGAPLFSGIIAGVVGGIVVASFSGSALSVCGPAAGLTTIVLSSIETLGSFGVFQSAIIIAGVMQFLLGTIRAGSIGNYFPSSVIKGMLTAIGLILILKQIPHAIGYDRDFEGDESFIEAGGSNTFSEILNAWNYITPGAVIIVVISLIILILWEQPFIKNKKFALFIPGPLIVVLIGIILNESFSAVGSGLTLGRDHLVTLPVAGTAGEFVSQFSLPDFSKLFTPDLWKVAITIAIVASLESLLSIDAVDKLDPFKRITPLNKELRAQGIGNFASGLIGGLPITSVIVRSSANVSAGARTKISSISHGILLLLTAFFIPGLLNKIPLSALAAILLTVGYKLAKPSLFADMFKRGWDQFIPFIVTVIAILVSDLLIGIAIGMTLGLIFILKTNFHQALFSVNEDGNYLIRLTKDVSFLNKAVLRRTFREIPDNSYVIIDGSRSTFIDSDIMETIEDFQKGSANRNIVVELKHSVSASNSIFKA